MGKLTALRRSKAHAPRDNEQIEDGELLAKLLDAMLPKLPAAKVKKKK